MTIQTKAIEQYFLVVLFIMLSREDLTLQFVDETLVCDRPSESYRGVPSLGYCFHFIRNLGYFFLICFGCVYVLKCSHASHANVVAVAALFDNISYLIFLIIDMDELPGFLEIPPRVQRIFLR